MPLNTDNIKRTRNAHSIIRNIRKISKIIPTTDSGFGPHFSQLGWGIIGKNKHY